MGFDLYGVDYTQPEGEYWRSNIWGWQALWPFVAQISKTAADQGEVMYFNDGHLVTKADAIQIADDIDEHIQTVGLPESPPAQVTELSKRNDALMTALVGTAQVINYGSTENYVATRLADFAIFCRTSGGFRVC